MVQPDIAHLMLGTTENELSVSRRITTRCNMEVHDAILTRRARRALGTKPVGPEKLSALVEAMRLSASCNNNQPWRVVICRTSEALTKARSALTKGNAWATRAPIIMVIAGRPEDDCHGISNKPDYFTFSTGLAAGQMLLRAIDLGIIAHPIAGFDPLVLKKEFGIPDDYRVITMVIIGYLDDDTSLLSDKQKASELARPERKPIEENFFDGNWGRPFQS
jgi:nitroreductase